MEKINTSVLIVNNEKNLSEDICAFISEKGFTPISACTGDAALKIVDQRAPDIMLLNDAMPDMEGIEVLKQVKTINKNIPVILMTADSKVNLINEAMKFGAYDFLIKPLQKQNILQIVQKAASQTENHHTPGKYLRTLMGKSKVVARLIDDVMQVAKSDFSVILLGETGSGKELIANNIHYISGRSDQPFVPVDCGAIPEHLLESELFGHEKGAFTSADTQKIGKFEIASGGTLFLDEIPNLPFGSQAKLLRFIQEKKLCRIGNNKPVPINVRLVAASNMNLEQAIAQKTFRRDLYYRLNDFTIYVPPLRERKEDVVYLAYRFMNTTNKELNKSIREFSSSAIEDMLAYNWPGNVRQLRSTIRRAVLLADEVITEKHLNMHSSDINLDTNQSLLSPHDPGAPDIKANQPPVNIKDPANEYKDRPLKEILEQQCNIVEKEVLLYTLRRTGGNKAKAARILQINYKTMHNKLKKHDISTEGDWL